MGPVLEKLDRLSAHRGSERLTRGKYGVFDHCLTRELHRKLELKVDRILRPQRAVVVEHGDAIGFDDEMRTVRISNPIDELQHRGPRRGGTPRGKRIDRFWRPVASPEPEAREQETDEEDVESKIHGRLQWGEVDAGHDIETPSRKSASRRMCDAAFD